MYNVYGNNCMSHIAIYIYIYYIFIYIYTLHIYIYIYIYIYITYIIQLHVSKVSKFSVVNHSKPIRQNIINKDM